MGRPPCCDKASVKRGLWTAEEDAKILAYVANNGTGNWTLVPKKAGLNRCGKSCRLRWTNYLRPDLKHESFSPQEEDLIIELHKAIGSRWSLIAKQLPGRTDNDVKNYWNTKLKKKLKKMGIDPVTHKPFSQIISDYGNISSITLPHFNPHFQPTNRRSALSIHPPPFEYQASMQPITPPLPLATLSSSSSSCSSSYQISTMMPMAALSQTPSNIDFLGPYLFDQLSPASSSSSSSSSSITTISSSSQSKVSQTSPYPVMPSSPSCWSNLIIATSETEKPPQVEENDPEYEFFNSVGGYGGDGVEDHKKSDDRNTLERGLIDPSSSPLNSFVKSILDRDSEMQLDFLALEEFLDY